ncbi:MAG: hypothetical protein JXA49_07985 [Actinobacteria bacterium]|nr:hypothetical protein [Actinomycetota bacterium]
MSMGDFPRLPDEMIPRVQKLADKVKAGEVELSAIGAQVMPPVMSKLLPKLMPTIMKTAGPSMAEAMPKLLPMGMSMLPAMMGKQLFFKVAGMGYYILKIGVPPKLIDLVPSSFEEIKKARIPGIFVDLDLIPMFFGGLEGMISMMGADMIKIYGVEEMMKWTDDMPGSSGTGDMTGMIGPIMGMMTKEFFDTIQGPYEEIGESVLSAFGV